MPTYLFKDINTHETSEKFLRIAELDRYKEDNPHLIQQPVILNAVGQIGGIKTDDGFKNLMNNIRKNSPGNSMSTY
jgi:hypothetical protein